MTEHWADAYERIYNEIAAEHPDWTTREIGPEYKRRVLAWKAERGIK